MKSTPLTEVFTTAKFIIDFKKIVINTFFSLTVERSIIVYITVDSSSIPRVRQS